MADAPFIQTAAATEPPEHIQYKITSQIKSETFTPDGRFMTVWRVGFEAPNGVHSYVEIPVAVFNPAEVDRVIEAELDTIMGVHGLGESPHPDNAA